MDAGLFLFLARHPPHGGSQAPELLDMVLAAAAFGRRVCLAFVDDGVFQLMRGQSPEAIGARDFARTFGALPDYDVEDVVVERESLAERGLDASGLLPVARVVGRDDIAAMIAAAKVVVGG